MLGGTYGVIAFREAVRTVGDSDHAPHIGTPYYQNRKPCVLFDAAHHNHHKLDRTYRAFRDLVTKDGATITSVDRAITADALKNADLLMIVTASGAADPGNQPAFTPAEIDAIAGYVHSGKALLLVVDHFPFGDANRPLAAAFGIDLSGGMTFDPEQYDRASGDDSQLAFTRRNGSSGSLLPLVTVMQASNPRER